MRQRKPKNLEQKLRECERYIASKPTPEEIDGTGEDVYIEIGCGKGQFIIEKAAEDPGSRYIGIEGQDTVILRGAQKAMEHEKDLDNLTFVCAFVHGMEEMFPQGSLAGIYLNFSDPWPKARHSKRRLTCRERLEDYAKVLRPGGFIEIKTDNDGLFDFTLEEIDRVQSLKIEELTRDLHGDDCDFSARNTTTEYENKFVKQGKKINYVKVVAEKTSLQNKINERGEMKVGEYILARGNGRHIPQEDKIFGISNRAKAAIEAKGKDKVINGTIGSLLDDEGELVVLESVDTVFKHLSPKDYAEYAPIGGIQPFKESVQKAAFGVHVPRGYIEAVATPGGTGSLRNVISNYSDGGDQILTSDWHWAPYNTIAGEIGRSIATYELFTEDGKFNVESFRKKSAELLAKQESLVIIMNTPAHNPTGYSLTLEDWDNVIEVLTEEARCGKAIALVIDVAYIDFAGDEEEYRRFLPKLEKLPENVISIVAYSLSKTFTLYGTRCGAMICVAKTEGIAKEFKRVCEYSSRGSWSNSAKVAQVILSRIYSDEKLLAKINEEREMYRNMLIRRGAAFSNAAKEVGLEIVPYDAGFFISIPCDDPDSLSKKLEEEDVFLVPLAKGLRVAVASLPEDKCTKLPAIIKEVIDK